MTRPLASGAWLVAALLLSAALAGCAAPQRAGNGTLASDPRPGADPTSTPSPPAPTPVPVDPAGAAGNATPAPTPSPTPAPAQAANATAPPTCPRQGPLPPPADGAPRYNGTLFDDHFHMPQFFRIPDHPRAPVLDEDISRLQVVCLFDPERIRGAFAFYGIPAHLKDKGQQAARDIEGLDPGAIAGFLELVVFPGHPVDPAQVEEILAKTPAVFDGYGEVSLYLPHYRDVQPDDAAMRALYGVAERHRLTVMVHPVEGQQQAFERALRDHPNVTFLFHGAESLSWGASLMDPMLGAHRNARYSIDTLLYGDVYGRPLLDAASGKADFAGQLRQRWNQTLDQKTAFYKPLIEKHPDQFLWGTDRGGERWHYDPEIAALLEEFARAFTARLDPGVQERFAFRNAYALLDAASPTRAAG